LKSSWLRRIVWFLAVVATVVGAVGSVFLTIEHVYLADKAQADVAEEDMGWFESVCTAFTTSSCEKVSQSPWGQFPFGQTVGKPSIPTAELGLVYFIFVFCWLVLIGSASRSRWWLHFLFAISTALGLSISIFLDYIMWAQLDYWCPICLLTHVMSLLVFLFALMLWPRAPKPPAVAVFVPDESEALDMAQPIAADPPWPTWRAVWTTFLVIALAIGLQHFVWMTLANNIQVEQLKDDSACQKKLDTAKKTTDYYKKQLKRYTSHWQHAYMAWSLETAVPISLENEPIRGPKNARHTIVLFSDLQCPSCGRQEEYIREKIVPMAKKYGGVKIIFKHWPICQDCNPYAYHNLHPQACLAARATEAALILGGDDAFWKMHDYLIERRREMKNKDANWFVDRGVDLGFEREAFRQAMDSEQAMVRIRAHMQEGENLGRGVVDEKKIEDLKVTYTPTIMVDNRKLRIPRYRKTWEMILRSNPKPAPKPVATQPKIAPAKPAPDTSDPHDLGESDEAIK